MHRLVEFKNYKSNPTPYIFTCSSLYFQSAIIKDELGYDCLKSLWRGGGEEWGRKGIKDGLVGTEHTWSCMVVPIWLEFREHSVEG